MPWKGKQDEIKTSAAIYGNILKANFYPQIPSHICIVLKYHAANPYFPEFHFICLSHKLQREWSSNFFRC